MAAVACACACLSDRGRQLTSHSFLHVYHHASMVVLTEFGSLYTPWPATSLSIAINCFVHVVLYTYYGVTAAEFKPPLWLKKLVTQIQIVQFLVILIHAGTPQILLSPILSIPSAPDLSVTGRGFFTHGFCLYYSLFALSLLGLFTNFYIQAYWMRSKRKNESTKKGL